MSLKINSQSSSFGFASSIGAIMASVGAAVGLGNIWRFPYICGKYGGAAFLLVYLFFVFFIGMVLLMSEFVIGRRTGHTPVLAMQALAPKKNSKWKLVGWFALFGCFVISTQYDVISGWAFDYFWHSCTGSLSGLGVDSEKVSTFFDSFSTSTVEPIVFLFLFALLVMVVILGGVRKGIENVSKVLMPMLLILVLVLCVRSLTLPNAIEGVKYLFTPDFSKLTYEGISAALGQALFSLSVGFGTMIVYGSYLPKSDNLLRTSMFITASDTLIAVLAGVAIFPAVFSCGMDPQGGPGLVFKVLPVVFNSMDSLGGIFSTLFFLLLVVAALTSAISMLEVLVSASCEHSSISRRESTVLFSFLTILFAAVISLSNGVWSGFKIAGMTLFDFVDKINSLYIPPICSLATVIFFGWVIPKDVIKEELSNNGTLKIGYFKLLMFLSRYVAPLALLMVLFNGII